MRDIEPWIRLIVPTASPRSMLMNGSQRVHTGGWFDARQVTRVFVLDAWVPALFRRCVCPDFGYRGLRQRRGRERRSEGRDPDRTQGYEGHLQRRQNRQEGSLHLQRIAARHLQSLGPDRRTIER